MTDKHLKFAPFANEADVVEVGNLTFENRLDRITIAGDIDLTLDKAGLAAARALQQLINAAVAAMEAAQLPDVLPAAGVKTVANPFD